MKFLPILLLTIQFITFGKAKYNSNQSTKSQHQFCDTIPFEYVSNKIIVRVKINGQIKRYIFDTGAISCISEKIQDDMKNSVIDATFLIDQSGIRKHVSIVSVQELSLGELTFENFPAAVINIENTGLVTCLDYDGIIGSNLLNNCIVTIDVDKKYIVLTNDIKKINLVNAYQTNLILDNQNSPYIQLSLNNAIKFNALFDSGASDFVSVPNKFYHKTMKNGISKVLNQGYGVGAIGAFSIEKAHHKKRIIYRNIKFGSNEIIDFVAEVSDKTQSSIGMELADYGTITIDFINKHFYFKAKQQKQVYKHQKTLGFTFEPKANYYMIGTVWTGTYAEKIGLKRGFQILKLDSLDLSERTMELDCKLLLSSPLNKKNIKMTYKDNNDLIKVASLTEE